MTPPSAPILPPALAVLLGACSVFVATAPGVASAQGSARERATDLVYEAADALDQARSELEAGRDGEAKRLLTRAERDLSEAMELDPTTPRLGYERARLHRLDEEPQTAEDLLIASMRGELPLSEHVRSVELLDLIRADLEKPSVGIEWRRTQTVRDAGLGTLAGGLVAAVVGFGIGFGTFAQEAYTGVTDAGIGGNRAGWGLSMVGGGVALGGGIMAAVGQVKLTRLRAVLPGPWRLSGAPPGLQTGVAALTVPWSDGPLVVLSFSPPSRPRVR